MSDNTETTESSILTDSRLRFVYIAGIALNVVALAVAAAAGELVIAVTFGFIIFYLGVRYWWIVTS